jgi:hypothetical protein
VKNTVVIIKTPTPDDHFAASPDRGVGSSPRGSVGHGSSGPSICIGVVFPAGTQPVANPVVIIKIATPDNHFAAGPNGRVIEPAHGRVRRACS